MEVLSIHKLPSVSLEVEKPLKVGWCESADRKQARHPSSLSRDSQIHCRVRALGFVSGSHCRVRALDFVGGSFKGVPRSLSLGTP
jgi:hypothetical protein